MSGGGGVWRTLAWCTWFSGGNEGAGGGESLTGCKGRTIKNCLGSGKFYPHKNMLFRTVFFKRKKPRNKFI